MNRARCFMAAMLLVVCFATVTRAGVTLPAVTITNYSGYVIDADAGGPGGRDTIDVQATLKVSSDSGGTVTNVYLLTFSLHDETNSPVDLRHGLSITGSVPVIAVVTVTTSTVSYHYHARLTPAGRLDPYQQYAPKVRVFDASASLFPIVQGNGDQRTYLHFTNTFVDADAYHLIPVFQSAAVTRASAWLRGSEFNYRDRHAFHVTATYDVHRYEVGTATNSAFTPVMLKAVATDQETYASLPLYPIDYFDDAYPTYTFPADPASFGQLVRDPFVGRYTNTFLIVPEEPDVNLDPTHLHDLKTTLIYARNRDGRGLHDNYLDADRLTLPDQRFLHFNNQLVFGAVTATVNEVTNQPTILFVTNDYVTASLHIAPGGATLNDQPDLAFNDTAPILVRVDSNGTAHAVSAGSWDLTFADGTFAGSSSNLTYTAATFSLSTNTLSAGTLTLRLPHGSGYANDAATQILEPFLTFNNVALDPATLLPRDGLVSRGGTFYVSEETKPFRFEANGVTWESANGRLTWSLVPGNPPAYVRGEALTTLEQAVKAGKSTGAYRGGSALRRSNESYLRAATAVSGNALLLRAGADGSALTSFTLQLASTGSLRAAFPYDASVLWTNAGATITYADDLIVPAASSLGDLAPVTVPYRSACPTEDCEGLDLVNEVTLGTSTSRLFTADGGLVLPDAATEAATRLRWNFIGADDYVHAITSGITTATFYMPGHFSRGNEASAAVAYLQPEHTLLAGLTTNLVTYEIPGNPAYLEGQGDYAGINIRRAANPGMTARSILGGSPINPPYALAERSKYYLRQSGISGIHQAQPGAFASSATLYGYPVSFSNFALAYLSGRNTDSRTAGAVSVPYPSAFTQDFQAITFTCLGDLDEAVIPAAANPIHLDYWAVDLQPRRLSFVRNQTCIAGSGTLALSMDGALTADLIPVYGELGFLPDGEIAAPEDGIAGLTSRFRLENTVRFAGPHGTTYRLHPVQEAYLNDHAATPASDRQPGTGTLNLAGSLDVAFFEDLAVHFMPAARTNRNWSYMAGGWEFGRGWTNVLGDSFLTTNLFDLANAGYPGPATVENRNGYRFGEKIYRPVASQRWLDIVGFDNTLRWYSDTRHFKMFDTPEEVDLLIVAAEQWVEYLDAENVWLGFGSRYLGIPKIDTTALMANAWDSFLGTNVTDFFVANTVTNEAGLMQFISLTNGLASLDLLVDDDMTLLDFALTNYVNEVVTNLIESIAAGFDNFETEEQLNERVDAFLGSAATNAGTLRHVVAGMTDRQQYATNYITILQDALDDVDGLLSNLVEGTRFAISTNEVEEAPGLLQLDRLTSGSGFTKLESASEDLFWGLFSGLNEQLSNTVNTIDEKISESLRKLAPKLLDAHEKVSDVRETVASVRARLDDGGDLLGSIEARLTEEEIDALCDSIAADVKARVIAPAIETRADAPNPVLARTLSRLIAAGIRASATLNNLHQRIVNPAVGDLDADTRAILDTTFGSIEDTLNEILTEVYQLVEDELKPMLGSVGEHVEAASIRGSVAARGDLIREVVLNAKVKINASDYGPVKAQADFYYNAQRGAAQRGCDAGPSEPAHQVELRVRGGPIKFEGGRLFARMNGLFAFQTSPTYSPLALKGGVESYAGYLPLMGRINLMNIAGTIGFAEEEAYIGARGDAFLHLNDIVAVAKQLPAVTNLLTYKPQILTSRASVATNAATNGVVISLSRIDLSTAEGIVEGFECWIALDAGEMEVGAHTNLPSLGTFTFTNDVEFITIHRDEDLTAYTSVVVYAEAFGNGFRSPAVSGSLAVEAFAETDQASFEFVAVMLEDPSVWDNVIRMLEPVEKVLYVLDEANLLEGKMYGGLFYGRACTLGPLAVIDDDVAAVVGEAPILGVLAYAGGDLILVDWGCWLTLGSGVGLGLFSFDDGPKGLTATVDVYGEALCTLSVGGRAQLTGAYNGWNTALAGSLRLKAKAGWCPVCLKFNKKLRIVLGHERWDISLD